MNSLTNIYSIVPRLPPAVDGVGDYALNLARQLRKDFNLQTHFIVGNPTWKGVSEVEGFPVNHISNSSANTLVDLLSDRPFPVLLHYVGYGYAKRGCPIWLVDGLQHWKSLCPQRSLVTMFHELYASSNLPWESSFWLSNLQKKLAARLAILSDICVTSKQIYSDIIIDFSRGKHDDVEHLSIFSNIGEPKETPKDLTHRQTQLVVFGSAANRANVYQKSQVIVEYVCQKLSITKILDIGSSVEACPAAIGKYPIIKMGRLSPNDVSNVFLESKAGFLNYPPDYLAKSTIFASYCAHKLLPINARGSSFVTDQIETNKHYWFPNLKFNGTIEKDYFQNIAETAYLWYQPHNLSSHIGLFAEILLNTCKK